MKQKPTQENQLSHILRLTALVVVVLIAISFIPSWRLGNMEVRRANILGDLVTFEEKLPESLGLQSSEVLDTSYLADLPSDIDSLLSSARAERESMGETPAPTTTTAVEPHDAALPRATGEVKTVATDTPFVPRTADSPAVMIEDYSAGGEMMAKFYHRLASGSKQPVRVAVMGDSFTESDILTSDLRRTLQGQYGGRGVGFVGFANPLAQYRSTLKHTFEGWDSYTVIQRKKAPEHLQGEFPIAGMIYTPKAGATAHFELNNSGGGEAERARLLFKNSGNTRLLVAVNGGEEREYPIKKSSDVQEVVVSGPIKTLDMRLPEAEGFVGYGVVFESDGGVAVDNYAVRSNSGLATFSMNSTVNKQIDNRLHYDLIILQYGLNVMSPDVVNYDYYSSQMTKAIDYLRLSFPDAAILVMSVSDRAQKKGSKAATMSVVPIMVEAQRTAARNAGAAFWSTFEAMGGPNAMPYFVEQGWASKDYTHINFKGGAAVAGELARSIIEKAVSLNGPAKRVQPTEILTDTLVVDSLAVDTIAIDSLAADSLGAKLIFGDSLAVDTLATDSLITDTLATDSLTLPAIDTLTTDTLSTEAPAEWIEEVIENTDEDSESATDTTANQLIENLEEI